MAEVNEQKASFRKRLQDTGGQSPQYQDYYPDIYDVSSPIKWVRKALERTNALPNASETLSSVYHFKQLRSKSNLSMSSTMHLVLLEGCMLP